MTHRFRTGLFFALGLLSGVIAGATALAALELLGPARVRAVGDQSVAFFTAALAPWTSSSSIPASQALPHADAPPRATVQPQQPDVFDVVIDRSARAHAAFGLRLVGTEDENFQVLLRDVPAAAVLSHGRQRSASTWMVGAADLKDLHLALNDGTPEAFDIRIDVLARGDVAGLSSVARVRLVEMPGKGRVSVAAIERAPAMVEVAAANAVEQTPLQKTQIVAPARNRARGETKSKTVSIQLPAAAVVTDAVSPPAAERHWPEGASALGAVAASPDRQLWWKMPPPTWSPFRDSASEP